MRNRSNSLAAMGVVAIALSTSATAGADESVPADGPNPPATQLAPATQPCDTQPAEEAKPYSLTTTERLTGNWGGARAAVEELGITFDVSLTSVYAHNVHGGVQTRNGHRVTGTAAYELAADLEKLGLLKGGTTYTLAESAWGNDIGEDRVGNLFGVNGAAYLGHEEIVVSELWYEQKLFDEKFRARLGKIDLTIDFDTNAYANDETAQFLSPALINMMNNPVPDRGLGAQMVAQPWEWLYAGIGAADAQATNTQTGFNSAFHDEDYFYGIAEIGLMPSIETRRGKLPGGYRFGLWYDPQPKDRFFDDRGGRRSPPTPRRDDVGFYFNMDQLLWKEQPDDESDNQGLGVFLRYGWADEECNLIEHFWSLGAQYQGLIPSRNEDVLAFGFAQGIVSDKLRAIDRSDRESVYELYYRIHVFPWLQITPDFQYLINPGANDGRDSFVAGLRVLASF